MGSRTTRGKHTSANILLGISLSVLLIASVIPVTYAVEGDATTSFMRFDGNDYTETASSPNLQLLQFTLEARFRISQMPAEPGFIISKSAGTGSIFDNNYALFVTKEGKVGGAFRADDGTEHAVYSDLIIVNSGWHTARVVYDGIKLKLKLDGITVDSKLVGKVVQLLFSLGSSCGDGVKVRPVYYARHSAGDNLVLRRRFPCKSPCCFSVKDYFLVGHGSNLFGHVGVVVSQLLVL